MTKIQMTNEVAFEIVYKMRNGSRRKLTGFEVEQKFTEILSMVDHKTIRAIAEKVGVI